MTLRRLLLLSALAAGCGHKPSAPAAAAAASDTARPWRKPGDKIDSILPMPEYLRRFRQGLVEPERLTGGASTREELARRFLAAVSSRDTGALAELAVTRAEFAWLIFPYHIFSSPPYELDPGIFWMQLTAGSAKGLRRTLDRYGSARLALVTLGCDRDTLQIRSAAVKVWSRCTMQYRAGADTESRPLYGSVVERDGRVKVLSFANGF